jgi:hypothetical protein
VASGVTKARKIVGSADPTAGHELDRARQASDFATQLHVGRPLASSDRGDVDDKEPPDAQRKHALDECKRGDAQFRPACDELAIAQVEAEDQSRRAHDPQEFTQEVDARQ